MKESAINNLVIAIGDSETATATLLNHFEEVGRGKGLTAAVAFQAYYVALNRWPMKELNNGKSSPLGWKAAKELAEGQLGMGANVQRWYFVKSLAVAFNRISAMASEKKKAAERVAAEELAAQLARDKQSTSIPAIITEKPTLPEEIQEAVNAEKQALVKESKKAPTVEDKVFEVQSLLNEACKNHKRLTKANMLEIMSYCSSLLCETV